mmetsp:Transcript_32827/g.61053  ORF Transcript_32827/g.61053 Transcript_32827/m.61053 type:complete len:386 (-) Transcript_32827:181-1338(-)
MGSSLGKMMMPNCFPKKHPYLKDAKVNLKEVFEADDDTPFSSIWTAEDDEGESVFHTPNGSLTPERVLSEGPDDLDLKEGKLEYSSWPEGKGVVRPSEPLAIHGQLSKVTEQKLSFCPGNRFKLRIGPDYPNNRKKAVSGDALYNLRAVDMIEHKHKISHIARFFDRSKAKLNPEEDVMEGDVINGIPRFFIVSYMLPDYAPHMWSKVTDGVGFTVVFFFVLSKKGLEAIRKRTGAYRVLQRFCALKPNCPDKMRGPNLWKNVVSVANFRELGLNYMLTGYIRNYNAKPWLSRNPDMHKFRGKDYYEVDLDIHVYNYIGLSLMNEMKSSLSRLVLDIGFVVQSEKDDEMPERILGCGRLSNISYAQDCIKVDWDKYDEQMRAASA